MARTTKAVLGESVSPPRPTAAGALWLAAVLSVPVFTVLSAGEVLWRLVY